MDKKAARIEKAARIAAYEKARDLAKREPTAENRAAVVKMSAELSAWLVANDPDPRKVARYASRAGQRQAAEREDEARGAEPEVPVILVRPREDRGFLTEEAVASVARVEPGFGARYEAMYVATEYLFHRGFGALGMRVAKPAYQAWKLARRTAASRRAWFEERA